MSIVKSIINYVYIFHASDDDLNVKRPLSHCLMKEADVFLE